MDVPISEMLWYLENGKIVFLEIITLYTYQIFIILYIIIWENTHSFFCILAGQKRPVEQVAG